MEGAMMDFAQKYGPWALIAGASEGLGVAFARELAARGVNLILLARQGALLEALAADIRAEHGVKAHVVVQDLTAPNMQAEVAAACDGFKVGTMIYNAGAAGGPEALIDQDPATALRTIHLNAIGQTMLAQHFGRGMVARGRGSILFVGSLGCVAGCKNLSVYSAVKAYTVTFAEGLWAEMQPHGVDVATLLIGRTKTPALMRTELPGAPDQTAADPADVAAFAIANLAEGPVIVLPELAQSYDALRSMPRRKAVQIMTRSLEPQTDHLMG
jgi:uncharacterized protein